MNSSHRYEIVLGALLHDVGKFFQRASPSESILSDVSRRMESTVCPVFKGRYSHRHVLFTNEFCDQHLKYLPPSLNKDSVTNYAVFHHRPDSSEQEIIQRADILSSGMEREEDEEYTGGPTGFRRVRLRSIMAEIRIPGYETTEEASPWVHNLTELDPEKAFPFPGDSRGPKPSEGVDLTEEYHKLWEKFVLAWRRNEVRDPWGFVNRGLGVLEHHTWCIPSATTVFPDISLYDHSKTTAAIAACLLDASTSQEPFLLVAIDFGGIQNYIYAIRSGAGGLARRLRARSFFVTLMEDVSVYRILRSLDLPMTNCIISSGGKSYLLLPNTEEVRQVVGATRSDMDHWSLDKTRGEIRMNVAMVSLSTDGLKDFSTSLEEVNAALREEKEKPLASSVQESGSWADFLDLLKPIAIPQDGGLCDSCQKNGGPMRPVRDRETPICDRCHDDQEAGRALPRSNYVAFFERSEGRFRLPFGSYDLLESAEAFREEAYLVLSMDGYQDLPPHVPFASAFRARYVPRNPDGDLKTFEELAQTAKGRKSLAYLKSDIDNLGFIFRSGLRRDEESDRISISRLTTLSRCLDLFFSGYFDDLLVARFPDVYTIYSGGDDLLCLGPWNELIQLASEIWERFHHYSCRNPAWSMSSGIVLVGSKTPVLSAASQADRLLDASKEIAGTEITPWPSIAPETGSIRKDRITVFGSSIPWREFAELMNRALWLGGLIENSKINTAKVRRLLRYAEMFRSFQRSGDTRHFRYVPLLAYDLRRNWSSGDMDSEQREALKWVQTLLIPESPEMPKLRFICEYALNMARQYGGRT